jgi:PAS domain S-box-containing protein
MRYSGSRIVIVDDEPGIRDLLQDNLEAEGYICYTAGSAEEALKVLAAQTVELAIVDIMMPEMTGLSLFGYIKELYPDVAVIFVTAVNDVNLGVQSLKDGASDYIVKPVTRKRLLQAAQDALERREAALQEGQRHRELEELAARQTAKGADGNMVSLNSQEILGLLETVPVGAFVVQEGRFVFVNREFEKLTGYRREEIVGGESLQLVVPEHRNLVRAAAIALLKGTRSEPYEFRSVVKDGDSAWRLGTVVSVQWKGQRAVLGYYMEISAVKRTEEELQKKVIEITALNKLLQQILSERVRVEEQYRDLFQRIFPISQHLDELMEVMRHQAPELPLLVLEQPDASSGPAKAPG